MALDVEGRCYTWGRNEVELLLENNCTLSDVLLCDILAEGAVGAWGHSSP